MSDIEVLQEKLTREEYNLLESISLQEAVSSKDALVLRLAEIVGDQDRHIANLDHLTDSYARVIKAIPTECETCGDECIPTALSWVENAKELQRMYAVALATIHTMPPQMWGWGMGGMGFQPFPAPAGPVFSGN